jgi:AcrR family transcriptional regulator
MARHIAGVAARLFATKGFDATSVREIVEAAGVTKPTLYYYFRSKEGLAEALLVQPLQQLIAEVRALVEMPGDSWGIAEQVLEAYFSFCRQDPDRLRFINAVIFGPAGSGPASEVMQFVGDIDALWLALAQRLEADGWAKPGMTDRLASILHGVVVYSSMEYQHARTALEPGLARRLLEELFQGFGTDRVRGRDRGAADV